MKSNEAPVTVYEFTFKSCDTSHNRQSDNRVTILFNVYY